MMTLNLRSFCLYLLRAGVIRVPQDVTHLSGAGDQAQGSMHTMQAFCQLSYTPSSLSASILVSSVVYKTDSLF